VELEFSADQDALRDAIRTVLVKEAPISLAREVAERGTGAERLTRVAAELGWPALTVPEAFGGVGLGAIEAGILAEELGRVVAPGPLLTTVCGFVPLVATFGTEAQQAHLLGAVARGELAGTVARGLRAEVGPGGDVAVHGTTRHVIEPLACDEIACAVDGPGGAGVVVVATRDVTIEPLDSIDPTRGVAQVVVDGVRAGTDRILGGTLGASPAEIAATELPMTCALALETVGVCQSIFDVTLDYARHRQQFGVAIASFQAIKHKFADMFVALERARATGYLAALCLAEADDRAPINVSVAKAAAGDAQRRVVQEGIQIHGGIGYTWEHDMQLYAKRAKANEALGGTAIEHRARIATALGVSS
jgi:alkylation response protein AidB-like acyl-CoA dehydrogenase